MREGNKMSYKPNFIKRDRVDSNKIPTIKDTYDRIKGTPDKLRKNEPFVLMFRNFIFFDVKSYECRNGDLYIRNIVEGIVLKRYFRMEGDDQLTVFKNREEFDAFMEKVENEGYWLGPEKRIEFKPRFNKQSEAKLREDGKIDTDGNVLKNVSEHSDEFILDNYIGLRSSVTGKIDSLKSDWDGAVFEREDIPDIFDKIVSVLEANTDRAEILTKNDFM